MVEVPTTKRKKNSFVEHLTQHRSPAALAAGASFGIALGLIPKDSLLALVLLAAILCLSINQLVACAFAIGLSALSGWTNGLTHGIGTVVLESSVVANLIVSIYQLPLVPWLRLENTIVMGGMVLGLLLWIPCFFVATRFCKRVRDIVVANQVAELAAANIRHRRELVKTESSPSADQGSVVDLQPVRKVALDSAPKDPEATKIRSFIASSAADVSEEPTVRLERSIERIEAKVESLADETVLRETLIEVVRYKQPRRDRKRKENSIPLEEKSKSMKLASPNHADTTGTVRTAELNTKFHSPIPGASHATLPIAKEESLRHIIKHIHGTREAKKETGKPA